MPKVLIDMSDNKLEWIRKKVYPNYIDNAIKNGIVLDGLTNGEVIQKMFPNLHIQEGFLYFHLKGSEGAQRVVATFDEKWMNRKWSE